MNNDTAQKLDAELNAFLSDFQKETGATQADIATAIHALDIKLHTLERDIESISKQ